MAPANPAVERRASSAGRAPISGSTSANSTPMSRVSRVRAPRRVTQAPPRVRKQTDLDVLHARCRHRIDGRGERTAEASASGSIGRSPADALVSRRPLTAWTAARTVSTLSAPSAPRASAGAERERGLGFIRRAHAREQESHGRLGRRAAATCASWLFDLEPAHAAQQFGHLPARAIYMMRGESYALILPARIASSRRLRARAASPPLVAW